MVAESSETLEAIPHNVWAEPYAEQRILSGFLRAEDVPIVYPVAQYWPEHVAARVRALHGGAGTVGPRSEAGQCRIFPVEEPEALAVLQVASQTLPFGADVPVSYSWVEISNLIATASVADPLPQQCANFSNDLQSLAEYSLFGPMPILNFGPNGAVYSLSNLGLQLVYRNIEDGQLVLKYQFSQVAQPILVGYEQGRFFLLNAYGRVLQALIGNVERLLCLVYYGLDLTTAHMGVRVLNPQNGMVNHFGPALLSGDRAPLVKDFLDPALSAVIPARSGFFIALPSVQVHQVSFTQPPSGLLPLNTSPEVATIS